MERASSRELSDGCPHEHCLVPMLPCVRGHDPAHECPAWEGKDALATETALAQGGDLPWAGGALGRADLSLIAACSRPRIVGLIGLTGAGKTTALTTLYLLLCQGHDLGGRTFAGSRTLLGWEALAAAMRWPPGGTGPGFPAHTTSTEREPGLLHLALRREDDALDHVLFTDAPGEWFREWAQSRGSSGAAGARWIARHADAVALFTDSEALAGGEKGEYRANQLHLIRRVAQEFSGRQVMALWSKADLEVPAHLRQQVNDRIGQSMPWADRGELTARPHAWDTEAVQDFLRTFDRLSMCSRSVAQNIVLPSIDASDPFLSFRGA